MASVTIIALSEGKVTVFTKSAIFLLFNLEGVWQFSNQITHKVVTENLNCYFYHVENV